MSRAASSSDTAPQIVPQLDTVSLFLSLFLADPLTVVIWGKQCARLEKSGIEIKMLGKIPQHTFLTTPQTGIKVQNTPRKPAWAETLRFIEFW